MIIKPKPNSTDDFFENLPRYELSKEKDAEILRTLNNLNLNKEIQSPNDNFFTSLTQFIMKTSKKFGTGLVALLVVVVAGTLLTMKGCEQPGSYESYLDSAKASLFELQTALAAGENVDADLVAKLIQEIVEATQAAIGSAESISDPEELQATLEAINQLQSESLEAFNEALKTVDSEEAKETISDAIAATEEEQANVTEALEAAKEEAANEAATEEAVNEAATEEAANELDEAQQALSDAYENAGSEEAKQAIADAQQAIAEAQEALANAQADGSPEAIAEAQQTLADAQEALTDASLKADSEEAKQAIAEAQESLTQSQAILTAAQGEETLDVLGTSPADETAIKAVESGFDYTPPTAPVPQQPTAPTTTAPEQPTAPTPPVNNTTQTQPTTEYTVPENPYQPNDR